MNGIEALDQAIEARGGPAAVLSESYDPRPSPPTDANAPRRFKLLSSADLRGLPPMRWRIHGALPEEGFAAIYGQSGSGKGFLVIHLMAAIADGADCFGLRTKRGRVVYVVLEGQAGIPKRVAAWEQVAGREFPSDVQFVFEDFKLADADDVLGLAASIDAAGGADVVVIDTLNRAAPEADENSAQDMGRLLEAVKTLQGLVGGLVVLVHHSGKEAGKGMRGHSSVYAALDAVIEVTRSEDAREWKAQKLKDDEDGQTHPFRLRRVELGELDEFGDPVTSCVVDEDLPDHLPTAPRPPLPRGGNQKIVHDALGPLLRASPHFGKAGAPAHRPCISLDDAVSGVRDRLVVEPKRRTERAQQAIRGLVATGVVGCNEGWLWLS